MALSTETEFGELVVPQAAASYQVAKQNSGLSTTGVLVIIGEADAGPRFDAETRLANNAYGVDQIGDIIAKYKSGNIVDAASVAASPSNDEEIQGSVSRIIIVKTNDSTKASGALTAYGPVAYANLVDKLGGQLGNLLYYSTSASKSEVVPSTGSFTFLKPVGSTPLTFRVNGGAALSATLSASDTPATAAATIDALSGVTATGGTDRGVVTGLTGATLTLTASGVNVTIAISGTATAWATKPTAGDTLVVPAGSVIGGSSNENEGSYVVTSSTTSSISATKLANLAAGAVTAPVNDAGAIGTPANELLAYAPVTISVTAADPVAGLGKSLEITADANGLAIMYVLGTSTKVNWLSSTGAPKLLTSSAEYGVTLSVSRQSDGTSESFTAGGEVGLKVGYDGTTAILTIDDTTVSSTVAGGAGGNFSVALKDFPTVGDLAAYINSLTGYRASAGTAVLGNLPSKALDDGTYGICSTAGNYVGRVKTDAYRFFNAVKSSAVVELQVGGEVVQAAAGLPQPAGTQYLSGGAKGTTTDTDVYEALAACEKVRANFVVPLFSRDASEDVTDGLTESGSTYTIASVHSNLKSHIIKMRAPKAKKARQGFPSIRTTFDVAKETAANLATGPLTCAFQDARVAGADGVVRDFQPWMSSVIAASMQAAGFYKSITNKLANISGAFCEGFDDGDQTQLEDALKAGLLPLAQESSGGWKWVSDQTTYGRDNNFVFNSTQAIYVADTIALTTAERMERAFVGQSLADVSAKLALSFFETVMDDFMRMKLITKSDEAPLGFKDASIKISGPTMVVRAKIYEATGIYFIPIYFLVNQVTQTA